VQILDDVEVTGSERATAAVAAAPPTDALAALEQRVQKFHLERAHLVGLEATGNAPCSSVPAGQSSVISAPLTFDGSLLSGRTSPAQRRC
jgi:hypothetical protein